jgi:hypothetical protein
VVVDQQDAVEAMAYYIALYISSMPEAQRMEPKQLQTALQEGFKVRAPQPLSSSMTDIPQQQHNKGR